MKVKYIGPFDEVEVPYVENGQHKSITFKRNHQAEVPDELAKGVEGEFGGLLDQVDNYVEVTPRRSRDAADEEADDESPKGAADKD